VAYIVVHHSDTPANFTPEQVADYHVNVLGWPGCGYGWLVGEDGMIYQCNSEDRITYHCGEKNDVALGVCFIGSFGATPPPDRQLAGGKALLSQLHDKYVDAEIVPHSRLSATACPGLALISVWEELMP
jgi:N-acetylmuramoyl-L-alanine amidase